MLVRRITQFILIGILLFAGASAFPARLFAGPLYQARPVGEHLQYRSCFESASLPEALQVPTIRARQADVLDTYTYFYCYEDPLHHNILCYLPSYRSITFVNSYTRLYPDEAIGTHNGRCPFNSSHYGAFDRFKCNYRTF